VMLLLDFWPLGRIQTGKLAIQNLLPLAREKIPFFVLAAVSSILTLQAQHAGHAIVSLEQLPLFTRLEVALLALAGYVGKLLWPADLCALYLLPRQIPALLVPGAAIGFVAVSFLAWRWRNSRPYFLVGWLWFVGMLVPVIGLVQVGDQAMADRYTYLPSIGFFIALVLLAEGFAARLQVPNGIRFGFAGLIGCACIIATEKQLPAWRDGEALFRRAVAVNPANDTALINLGVTLSAQGRFAEAVETYQQAVKTGSRRVQLHNNLGNALGLLGRHEESLASYREALRLAPQNPVVRFGAGKQLAALGRLDAALGEFAEAVRLAPNYAAPQLEAGKALFKLGQDNQGLAAFQRAVQLAPKDFQTLATVAHYLAVSENAAVRDGQTALSLALRANELSGGTQPVVLDYLGMAYAENGDFTNAIVCAQQAVSIAAAAGMDAAAMQQRIGLYQNRQPWRESFRATNPPAN
jgi:tetratricopeptide (TPR) repeat protein